MQKVVAWSCVVSVACVFVGIGAILCSGTSLPKWALNTELVVIMLSALFLGFASAVPSLSPWFRLRSIQGCILVCCGVAVVFLPLQLILAAVLIGLGTRLVWAAAACDLETEESVALAARLITPRTAVVKAEDSRRMTVIDGDRVLHARRTAE